MSGNIKVLIVDDSSIVRQALTKELNKIPGIEVVAIGSSTGGTEALVRVLAAYDGILYIECSITFCIYFKIGCGFN